MRSFLILTATLLTMACDQPATVSMTVDTTSFEGNWYGIRPDGVNTFHSDSSFFPNGDIVVRFFTCLSTRVESQWTDRGSWTYADELLTITLTTKSDRDEDGEPFTQWSIRGEQRQLLDETSRPAAAHRSRPWHRPDADPARRRGPGPRRGPAPERGLAGPSRRHRPGGSERSGG